MKYIYFGHNKGGKHNGVICVGFEHKYNCNSLITYSVALCSPKDNFSRKLARTIINGRMKKGISRVLVLGGNRTNKEMIDGIIDDYDHSPLPPSTKGRVPEWAKSIKTLSVLSKLSINANLNSAEFDNPYL